MIVGSAPYKHFFKWCVGKWFIILWDGFDSWCQNRKVNLGKTVKLRITGEYHSSAVTSTKQVVQVLLTLVSGQGRGFSMDLNSENTLTDKKNIGESIVKFKICKMTDRLL